MLEFLSTMRCFLCKTIPLRMHIINSKSLTCVQNQWLSVRYCHPNASNRISFTVSYFLNTFGFSPEEAAAASKRVTFETPEKPDSVIKFLRSQGFSQTQICFMVRQIPLLLRYDPEKTFLPKIEFFKSLGFSSSDTPKLISSCPEIMRRSLNNQLIPKFDLFLQVGVPKSNIVNLLRIYPRIVSMVTRRAKEILEELNEMGFDPRTTKFIMAVHALGSLSKSTRAQKVKAYKKWGWSDSDIRVAFRCHPCCIKVSEDKIDGIMDILVNKLGCEPSSVPRYAMVLALSLSKRIAPRASVLQVLLSKGQVRKESLLKSFLCTERAFLGRYILCGKEEDNALLKLYLAQLELKCKS